MASELIVNGIILSGMPIREADKRVVILSAEMGRLSAFVRGAKRMNSPLGARTRTFAFGKFYLSTGRDAYTVVNAEITEYFEEIVKDVDLTAYGCYFLELAQLFARENVDETGLLSLLYYALKALCRGSMSYKLIRRTFELKLLAINGLSPDLSVCAICRKPVKEGFFKPSVMQAVCRECEPEGRGIPLTRSTLYAFDFIRKTPPGKLFSFDLKEEHYVSLASITDILLNQVLDREPESRKMLEILTK